MVRTAVRAIVLSVCKVPDEAVRAYVSSCTALLLRLNASLRSGAAALQRRLQGCGGSTLEISSLEAELQELLDELYFINDLVEVGVPMLSSCVVTSFISGRSSSCV